MSDQLPPPMEWPKRGDSLFSGTDREDWLNACVGWARGKPHGYVEGYRRAAMLVFKEVETKRAGMDSLVYPLSSLWRHAIELQLKRIIRDSAVVLEDATSYPKHHLLEELWPAARARITKHGCAEDGPSEETIEAIEAVDGVVAELVKIDSSATEFRYFEHKKGGATLQDAPELINLRQMNGVLYRVSNFLDCVQSTIAQERDSKNEAMALDYANQDPDDEP
ncbi:MAG TPA: hypothetical protein VK540_13985 [Polyangiaceae bacterium]|nr:hypothetical protein [Polyangiaceae bacterium]